MSILIKGMEMPTSCSRCPMLEGDRLDGLCHAASKWLDDDEHWTWYAYPEGDIDDSKPCNCPLVPVPKHGRLIDADALQKDIQKHADLFVNCGNLDLAAMAQRDGLSCALSDVVNAPTIIEAEEEEHGRD